MLLKRLRAIDWFTTVCIICITSISLLCIYSSTVNTAAIQLYTKQVFGVMIGLIIYAAFSLFPAYQLRQLSIYGFYCTIGLLLLTGIFGTVGMGAQRWIHIAGLTFQPAELMKLFTPFFIVAYLSERDHITADRTITGFLPLFTLLATSCFLVLQQPDLGTAILLFVSGSLLLWLAGLPTRFFGYIILLTALSTPILWHYIRPYQQQRILVFLGAGSSHKERYHLEQSKIAIGSGGICGKGWQNGTQNRLRFLPERRTDFIFSVLCEEFGFLGACVLIILYILLFARIFSSIYTITSFAPKLLVIGLALPHTISIFVNIGMVMGLLPIVGIPLPLMSYGLSHLWTTCACLGSINSIIDKWMYR